MESSINDALGLEFEEYLHSQDSEYVLRSASRNTDNTPLHKAADAHLQVMTLALRAAFNVARKALKGSLRAAGDVEGHEFHGNQWTSDAGGERSFDGVRWRTETGEKVIDGDIPPERTKSGDYIIYHGTSEQHVESIKQNGLRGDNIGAVGFATTPGSASMMGGFHGKDSATLRIVVDKQFMEKQAHVTHESNAKDLFLLHHPEGERMNVPPSAIKSVQSIKRLSAFASAPNISACISTLHAALLKVLPPVLLATMKAGGDASLAGLKKMRAAGDLPGHEFHGNQWTTEGGGTLYHGTSSKLLPSIQSKGLIAGHTKRKGETGSANISKSPSRNVSVYLSKTEREARDYADVAAYAHGGHPVVVAVDIPKEYAASVVNDEQDQKYESLRFPQDIPARWVRGARSLEAFRTLKPQVAGKPHDVKPPFGLAFNVSDPRAVKWAKEHAAELAKDLSETSRDDIKAAIAASLEGDGLDYDAILAAVGDEARADMIARTEVMTAANEGNRQGWQQAADEGVLDADTTVEWIATSDACPECEALDGETRTLDGEYPDDGGDGPPLHPNCRCTEGISG